MTQRFLLVSGFIRSGTTLLSRGLHAHPEIACVNNALFPIFKRAHTRFLEEHGISSPEDRPIGDLFDISAENKEAFRETIAEVHLDEADLQHVKADLRSQNEDAKRAPQLLNHLDQLEPGTLVDVLRNAFSIVEDAYGDDRTTVIASQQHWCEQFLEPILDAFDGEIQALNILRDPRAVFASRNSGSYLDDVSGERYALLFLVRHWRKSAAFQVLGEQRPDFMGITYEDLVTDPEATHRSIAKFLGVPFHENTIDVSTYRDGRGDPWKTNTSYDEEPQGITDDSLKRWKKRLDAPVPQLLEWLCEPELAYFGFERPKRKMSFVEAASQYEEPPAELRDYHVDRGYRWGDANLEVEAARRHLWTALSPDLSPVLSERLFIDDQVHGAYGEAKGGGSLSLV